MDSNTRIMKRHTGSQAPGRVAFNFEDVQSRCEDYKEQVRTECRQLIVQAQRQADEIRGRSVAEGHSEGYRNGLGRAETEIAERSQKRAEELVAERLKTVVPAVATMLEELESTRSQCRLEWERELVGTAVAIADRILRQRLESEPELAADVIAEAVKLAMGATSLQIQLNPVDLVSLGGDVRSLAQDAGRGVTVELVEDSAVSPGGCVVKSENGQIDGRLESMLDQIASELLDGLE